MDRSALYQLWRTRVEECGGLRPAIRKYGEMRRSTLSDLLAWGRERERGYELPEGYRLKGESVLVDADNRVHMRWIKTREDDSGQLVEALQKAFDEYGGKAEQIAPPVSNNDDLLTLYPLPDLHFGMYSWREETGADYDTNIAAQIARDSIHKLVAKAEPSKRAVLLGLGDLFHQNDQSNSTPAHKHRLDVDGRWSRVFDEGARLLVELIDLIAQKHEEVEVVILPGNHDEDAAVCLRVALSLFYNRNSRIQVYDRPGLFWYARHGKCLLGATHGHTIKPDRMALMLATDRPRDWGETLHRNFFYGHIHTETARDITGVRVESFTTPAARDAFAQNNGYRSVRSLSALTFHAELGETDRSRVNIIAP